MKNRNDSKLKLNASRVDDLNRFEFPSPEEIELFILEARRQRKEFFFDLIVRAAGALRYGVHNRIARLFPNRGVVDNGEPYDLMA